MLLNTLHKFFFLQSYTLLDLQKTMYLLEYRIQQYNSNRYFAQLEYQ